jgi:hypothetical protein
LPEDSIYDDTQEYLALCDFYGEKPRCDRIGPDPYSKHAHELRKRYRKDKREGKTDE